MKNSSIIIGSFLFLTTCIYGQNSYGSARPGGQQPDSVAQEAKEFTVIKENWISPYKSQGESGMCWIFSTVNMLESELYRMGRGEYELSQPFIAYHDFISKAVRYVRLHGKGRFLQGGLAHNAINMIREHGIVPMVDYRGLPVGQETFDHRMMMDSLNAYIDEVLELGKDHQLASSWKNGEVSLPWLVPYVSILYEYLTPPPEMIICEAQQIIPLEYASDVLQIPLDDYVEITSYSFLPFYTRSELLLPDNWMHNDKFVNVPLDDWMEIIDNAIYKGFTLVFDLDISPAFYNYFENSKGWIGLPEDLEQERITQDVRDDRFENWITTDRHFVQCYGIAVDQDNKKYYLIKDSIGPEAAANYGYEKVYPFERLTENWVKANVVYVMVNKNAIPERIIKQLIISGENE